MSRLVVCGPGGGSPNRLEINAFIKNDKYFSLYIQALQLMYTKKPQTAPQSFFQVGGIHGLPFTPWDGVTVDPPVDLNRPWAGYCTHGSVLFPTWHRLYVTLFEQILWNHAQEIAATYTVDQTAWKVAATALRQPYWDWAINPVPPAEVISLLQVNITGPDGKRKPVDNPLYHYKFHPIHPSFFGRFAGWPTTLRQPTSDSPNATDDIARLKAILTNAKYNTKSNVYNMLTRITTWPAFSNPSIGDAGSLNNSLEGIHNNIHVFVGGHGHLGHPVVAGKIVLFHPSVIHSHRNIIAFDPIFFLHHSNVDRLLSLWGALHPGVWVSEGDSKRGTFTIPAGVGIDTNTNLTPFYNPQTTFWASADVINTSKLGYTYPEFNGLATSNPGAIRKAIAAIVNELYGSETFGVFPPSPNGIISSVAQQAPADRCPWDWTARIEFKKFEIGTSFSVVLFLGQVPENPKDYLVSPNFVGAYAAFVNSLPSRCQNCQNQVDLIQEGFVHLSRGILEHGQLGSLEADVVEPYLTRELHWRAIEADSKSTEIPSLEVSVFSTPLSYPPGSAFSIAGVSRRHNGITHGRPGGSREAT